MKLHWIRGVAVTAVIGLAVFSLAGPVGATPIPTVGFLTFEEDSPGLNRFVVGNETGTGGDPTFPVTDAVSFLNSSLVYTPMGGVPTTLSLGTIDPGLTATALIDSLIDVGLVVFTADLSLTSLTLNDGTNPPEPFVARIDVSASLGGSPLVPNQAFAPIVAQPASIPEPGTFMLMVAGVTLLGAALRLRPVRRHLRDRHQDCP